PAWQAGVRITIAGASGATTTSRVTTFSSLPSRALRENARIVAGLVESGGGTAIVVFHVPGVPVPDVDCTLRSHSTRPPACTRTIRTPSNTFELPWTSMGTCTFAFAAGTSIEMAGGCTVEAVLVDIVAVRA